jgi:predicted dehydrogenase
MDPRKVRFAVIGGGTWGNHHLLAARQLEAEGKIDLVAIADQHEPTAAKQAEAYNIQKYVDFKLMLEREELDAVGIATPDHLHREVALFAMEQGKHVLVEKPLDLTTSGCQQMVDAARNQQVMLMVDFHKRYDPYNIDVKQKVHSGRIGKPQISYAYMEDKITVPLQMLKNWAAESSPFWFIGVHKLDLICWITGGEPASVYAQGHKGKLVENGLDTYDSVSARIVMEDGLSCTIDVNWIIPESFEALVNQGLRIIGTEGMVEIDGQERGLRYCAREGGMVTPNLGSLNIQDSPLGHKLVSGYYVDPIKDFLLNVYYLKNGGRLTELDGRYPSGSDGLRATRVAEAVDRSIREKRVVEIQEIALQ